MSATLIQGKAYKKFQEELDNLFHKFKKESKKANLSYSFHEFTTKLSTQIIHRSIKLFSRIPSQEYLNPEKNFKGLTDYYNQLSLLVSASILQQESRSKRVFCYEVWVRSINACIKSGDYTGAFSIYNGLNFYYMDRYVKTDSLSPDSKEILNQFTDILGNMLNSGKTLNFQSKLLKISQQEKKPMIPQMTGIMSSFDRAKQVFKDNQNEFKRILSDKEKVETKIKELLQSTQTSSSSAHTCKSIYHDIFKQHQVLKHTYAQLKSEYAAMVKEYDGHIAKSTKDDRNICKLQEFLSDCVELNEQKSSKKISKLAHHYSKKNYHLKDLLFKTKVLNEDKIEEFAVENCNKATSKKISKTISKTVNPELVIKYSANQPLKHANVESMTTDAKKIVDFQFSSGKHMFGEHKKNITKMISKRFNSVPIPFVADKTEADKTEAGKTIGLTSIGVKIKFFEEQIKIHDASTGLSTKAPKMR